MLVDEAAMRDADQPGPGVAGLPLGRPLTGRSEQGLSSGILTVVQPTVHPSQRTEHARRLAPPHLPEVS